MRKSRKNHSQVSIVITNLDESHLLFIIKSRANHIISIAQSIIELVGWYIADGYIFVRSHCLLRFVL